MYIYPENLKAKPMLWLWLLRDVAVIGLTAILSVLALANGMGMAPASWTFCAGPPVSCSCASSATSGGWTHEAAEKR